MLFFNLCFIYEETWNLEMFTNLYNVKASKCWSWDLDLCSRLKFLSAVLYLIYCVGCPWDMHSRVVTLHVDGALRWASGAEVIRVGPAHRTEGAHLRWAPESLSQECGQLWNYKERGYICLG